MQTQVDLRTITVFERLIRFSEVVHKIKPHRICFFEVVERQGSMVPRVVKLLWDFVRSLESGVFTIFIVVPKLKRRFRTECLAVGNVNHILCTSRQANVVPRVVTATSACSLVQPAICCRFGGRKGIEQLSKLVQIRPRIWADSECGSDPNGGAAH